MCYNPVSDPDELLYTMAFLWLYTGTYHVPVLYNPSSAVQALRRQMAALNQ
jgi:hypothetical protein